MDVKTDNAFEVMREALEMNFADQCRLHDQVIHKAVEAFESAKSVTPNHYTEQGLAFSRLADAVKAIMLVQFPVAAREWHGPERN